MDDMKISFKVEITGCIRCPYCSASISMLRCEKAPLGSEAKTALQNTDKLTKTCPMVRAQFEALE